jgi:hypothetical protein
MNELIARPRAAARRTDPEAMLAFFPPRAGSQRGFYDTS